MSTASHFPITIQIVGWNSAATLPDALHVLAQLSPQQAIVRFIDNASTDGSARLVKQLLPTADIIALPANTGFTGAHNIGLARCDTPLVLLHDPDVVVDWDGIMQLTAAFDDPRVAGVQGKLLRSVKRNGQSVIDSTGIIHTIALNGRERGANEIDHGQYEETATILGPSGACALYRMAALREVAYAGTEFFDADFFAYKEDVDLGWRLTRAGWRCVYQPIPIGTHRRTLGRRGRLNWGLAPRAIIQRLRSERTRYSVRNYAWMVIKNIELPRQLLNELAVEARLLVFAGFTLLYPPFGRVWAEIAHGLPVMLAKRRKQAIVHRS